MSFSLFNFCMFPNVNESFELSMNANGPLRLCILPVFLAYLIVAFVGDGCEPVG